MKKLLSMIIVVAVLCTQVGFADTVYKPFVRVVANSDIQVVKSGEGQTYQLKIKNTSKYQASYVKVALSGDHPFRKDVSELKQDIGLLSPSKDRLLNFSVQVSPFAESRIYEFDVIFTYPDSEGNEITNTEKAYVSIQNFNTPPIVAAVKYGLNAERLTSGRADSLHIDLRNDGTVAANNVRVTLTGLGNSSILLYNDSDMRMVETIKGGVTERVNFMVIAGNDTNPGTYELTAHIEYKDEIGKSYQKETPLYVNIAGSSASNQDIEISNINYPKSIGADQDFMITYRVTNHTDRVYSNLQVALEYPDVFINRGNALLDLGTIPAKSSKDFTIKMRSKAGISTETYHCYLKLSSLKTGGLTSVISKEYVGIFVDSDSAGSKPKLIIADYSYGSDSVLAGEEFELTLHIKNTSSSEATQNIKVSLASEGSVFIPVDSSNSVFIDRIGAGQQVTKVIRLKTKVDAEVRLYTIDIKMAYEDGSGKSYDSQNNPYVESEAISLSVSQPIRLETGELMMPYEVFSGSPFNIDQEFYNLGKSTMYNLVIKIEGVEVRDSQYFVGNFEPGRSDFYSVQATAMEPGEFEGKLIFNFEDALGTKQSVEKTFKYIVMEQQMPNEDDKDYPMEPQFPDESQSKKGIPSWIYYVVGGILLVVIIVIVMKRRAKRRAKALEEME